jgi:hypothetical protein
MSEAGETACALCRYWQPASDEDGTRLGLCRRGPPSYEGWPMTSPVDWCGEFAPRD